MKIDNPIQAQVSTGALQQAGGVTPNGGPGQSKFDGLLDEVQLSNLGAALRELSAREAVEDPGAAERSAGIFQRIAEGRYDVDTQALSKKIIEETTSLS